jgi:hypothetical protein
MKKLALCMIISTILTFTAIIALAHDDDNNCNHSQWKRFHGTYEMIASGVCNHSTSGWTDAGNKLNGPTPPWIPVQGAQIWAAHSTIQGTVQFKRNGTGTLSGTNYISLLPGGQPIEGVKEYQVSQSPVSAAFTYEITNNGEITIITSGGLIMNGMITSDRKVINLVNANQILDLTKTPYKSYAIQNMIRVLTRVCD